MDTEGIRDKEGNLRTWKELMALPAGGAKDFVNSRTRHEFGEREKRIGGRTARAYIVFVRGSGKKAMEILAISAKDAKERGVNLYLLERPQDCNLDLSVTAKLKKEGRP
jgi:hypothetical protein